MFVSSVSTIFVKTKNDNEQPITPSGGDDSGSTGGDSGQTDDEGGGGIG